MKPKEAHEVLHAILQRFGKNIIDEYRVKGIFRDMMRCALNS